MFQFFTLKTPKYWKSIKKSESLMWLQNLSCIDLISICWQCVISWQTSTHFDCISFFITFGSELIFCFSAPQFYVSFSSLIVKIIETFLFFFYLLYQWASIVTRKPTNGIWCCYQPILIDEIRIDEVIRKYHKQAACFLSMR